MSVYAQYEDRGRVSPSGCSRNIKVSGPLRRGRRANIDTGKRGGGVVLFSAARGKPPRQSLLVPAPLNSVARPRADTRDRRERYYSRTRRKYSGVFVASISRLHIPEALVRDPARGRVRTSVLRLSYGDSILVKGNITKKLSAFPDNSKSTEKLKMKKAWMETDLMFDILIPTIIIGILLFGNGIIIFIIFQIKKRKLATELQEEELQIAQNGTELTTGKPSDV